MKAVTWCGRQKVRVDNVPDPKILNPRDAIVRITSTCICGSDLHLYDGYIPTMQRGDIIGHEFMGIVEEVGPGVNKDKIKKGDRIVNPFTICCGSCWFCQQQLWSCCDNSNPNAGMAEKAFGYSPAGLFGYSHLTGGYAGGQAQYARIPYADVGPLNITGVDLTDEQVVFLSDIFPTGYMAAEQCDLKGGEVVAVWGCGPVGQFAIRSAYLLGASHVIAIDSVPERMQMASDGGATVLDMKDDSIYHRLYEMTAGRGPDACIEAVGNEAHGTSPDAYYDMVAVHTLMATDKAHALRQAINCCRKGGVVSIVGVFGGIADKIPMGAAMNKGLTFRMGQTHMPKYMRPLLERIQRKEIDPSFVATHRIPIDDAPMGYEIFKHKRDRCVKVVLDPFGERTYKRRPPADANEREGGRQGGRRTIDA
ncbi:MAG TPA: zinc-dependent alcohol dehydrogenase [Tepidisphaeraceae bacterium]|jgi:threonine dehydrogenase-like Zn-dependent dehydrogenase